MAEETLDRAIKAGILRKKECRTRNFSFCSNGLHKVPERLRIYGDRALTLLVLSRMNPGWETLVHPRLPYCKAEIAWICSQ